MDLEKNISPLKSKVNKVAFDQMSWDDDSSSDERDSGRISGSDKGVTSQIASDRPPEQNIFEISKASDTHNNSGFSSAVRSSWTKMADTSRKSNVSVFELQETSAVSTSGVIKSAGLEIGNELLKKSTSDHADTAVMFTVPALYGRDSPKHPRRWAKSKQTGGLEF